MRTHFILFISLLLATLAGKAQIASAADTDWYVGHESEPSYTITTAAQLAGLAELVNNGTAYFENKTVYLGCDIELAEWLLNVDRGFNGGLGWKPIGTTLTIIDTQYPLFRGIFDGQGHTISGLWINRPTENQVGLFGAPSPLSTIQNLTVTTDHIVGVVGLEEVGILFGGNGCAVVNCHVRGKVTGTLAVGGLAGAIGFGAGPVINCSANVDVTGDNDLGGLIGASEALVTKCYAVGTVAGGSTSSITGGLIGHGTPEDITSSYHTGANNDLGTYCTDDDLRLSSTFADWDFLSDWAIDPKVNGGLPILRVLYPGTEWYFSQPTGQPDFILSIASELGGLARLVNAGHDFEGVVITLDNDIDLTDWLSPTGSGYSGGYGWKPIGGYDGFTESLLPFKGTFDGAGHTISGLWSNRTLQYRIGLFGVTLKPGVIRNLTVAIDTDKSGVKGHHYVGGLAGTNHGTITHCAVLPMAEASAPMVTGSISAGGLTGSNKWILTQSYTAGTVKGSNANTGGLAGENTGLITDCYATGNVEGTNGSGGLIGMNRSTATLARCYATGTITGDSHVSGLTGSSFVSAGRTDAITACFFLQEGSINDGLPMASLDFLPTTNGITASRGATAAEMQSVLLYTDTDELGTAVWSFADIDAAPAIWAIDNQGTDAFNNGFPYLRWQTPTETSTTSDDDNFTTAYTVTLIADPGILLLPSAGTHGATIGGSFTFYVTLAEGFEGRTPQATVNGDPVALTLRPDGTEWIYTIPRIYDDTRVIVSFSTTANDPVSTAKLYSRDGQLFIETAHPVTLTVYSVTGQAIVARHLTEGLTALPLPTGIYIVKLDNQVLKVAVRR